MLKLCFSLQHGYYYNPNTQKLQHTSNQEQYDQFGNSKNSRKLLMMDILMSETCWISASACNTDTTPTQPHRNSNTHRTKKNTTSVVIQQNSRKLLISLQHGYHSSPTTPKLQHTSNQEQYDQCGNSTEQSQAPDDGYINVRNTLST